MHKLKPTYVLRTKKSHLQNKDDQMTELIKSFNKIVTTLSERNWIELNEKNLSTPANKKQGKKLALSLCLIGISRPLLLWVFTKGVRIEKQK